MGYGFFRSVTVDQTKVGGTVSSFPLLISIQGAASVKTVANGGRVNNTVTQVGGSGGTIPADLVFSSDPNGTSRYAWEVEQYDPVNGNLVAWVNVPTINSSTGAVLYMVYGDPAVTTQQNTGSFSPASVWDSFYKAVWHYVGLVDSTGNNSPTNHGTTSVTGKVGGGIGLVAGSSQYFDTPDNTSLQMAATDQITFSFWMKSTSTATSIILEKMDPAPTFRGYQNFVNAGTPATIAFVLFSDNSTMTQLAGRSTNGVSSGNWIHVCITYDGTRLLSGCRIYLNGVQETLVTITDALGAASIANTQPFNVGRRRSTAALFYDGALDDMRISKGIARTAAWVLTEYNNQNLPGNIGTPGFVTYGAETVPTSLVNLTGASIVNIGGSKIQIIGGRGF